MMMSRGVLAPVRGFNTIQELCFCLLFIQPALADFQITNDFSTALLQVGESFRVEWKDAYEPVALRLMNGSDGHLNLVAPINTDLYNGYYDWTPEIPGRQFSIEIRDQSSRGPNYSGRFDVRRRDGSLPPFPDPSTSSSTPTNEPTTTQTDAPPPSRTSSLSTTPTSATPTPTTEPVSGFEALSTGAKAGIGAGAGASAILLLFLICYFFYRRGRSAGFRASADAFRAASASGAFGVGGGRQGGGGGGPGGNPEDVEYGRSASGRGVYSPTPDSDLGMPPPVILSGEGISGSGFASSDNKSVPTLVSSVPDPPPPVHAAGNAATATGSPGTITTQVTGGSEFARDSPAAGAVQTVGPVAGSGVADGTVGGGGAWNTNTNDNISGSMTSNNVAAPYAYPPTPGPGVYEMPTSPGIMPGTMHMTPQGHGTVPAQIPLVNSQPYFVYGAPGTGQPMRMVMQPYHFDEGASMGRVGPGEDIREGR